MGGIDKGLPVRAYQPELVKFDVAGAFGSVRALDVNEAAAYGIIPGGICEVDEVLVMQGLGGGKSGFIALGLDFSRAVMGNVTGKQDGVCFKRSGHVQFSFRGCVSYAKGQGGADKPGDHRQGNGQPGRAAGGAGGPLIARRALPDWSVITGNARKGEGMDRGWGPGQ